MRTVIHFVLLFGILSLSLVSLTGCGEKRLHVVTLSGTPGEEAPVEPINSGHESSMPAHTEVASAGGNTGSYQYYRIRTAAPHRQRAGLRQVINGLRRTDPPCRY